MTTLLQDLRYGFRSIRRTPLFAVVSVLTLALAIGVNTSIFSLVSAIVFADLPMRDTESVALIRGANRPLGIVQGSLSVPDYLDLAERSSSFEQLTALRNDQWVITGNDLPMRVTGYRASANLFDVWRLPPILGRGFVEGEDLQGAGPVVVLSHPFWQSRYAGENVLGETLRLDGTEHTIVGVADPKLGFADFATADVWVPLTLDRTQDDRARRSLFVTGRLNPGVSQEQATQEAAAIGRALQQEFPDTNTEWEVVSTSVMDGLINDEGRTIMLMLMLTVAFVILIACANVANMLLARSTARAQEFAVRTALGASRPRVIRQLLTESLVISVCAALLGLAFAWGLNESLVRISNGQEPALLMARLDARTLGFTLALSLLAPLVFGLFPAFRASADPSAGLTDARGADGARSGKRARGFLVGTQVALAVSLMVVAGLLVRSVYNLQTRELGFDSAGLVAVALDLPENEYPTTDGRRQFYQQALEGASSLPTVSGAALLNVIPGAGFGALRSIDVEGRPVPEGQARPSVLMTTASAGWSELLGLPLVAGRRLGREDGPDAPPVAVIARDVAALYWPDEDPVGRRIRSSEAEPWIEIVGVVGDVRATTDSERPAAHVYRPYRQVAASSTQLVVRSNADHETLFPALREVVWAVDRNQPIDRIQSFDQALYDNSASTYALLTLFASFAVFALLMAGIGIYGVMSYSVSQRRAEFGLRMALGAQEGQVKRMVVVQGIKLVAIGIGIGMVAAFMLSRLLEGLVFGISSTDPVTFLGVPLLLAVVALIANYLPARAATRGDPLAALRSD